MSTSTRGMRLRTRIAATLGVVVFLVLAGTGAGFAYWTATSAVTATATSTNAAVALTAPATLTTTYTSTAKTSAPVALTLANTGGSPLGLALTATTTNTALSGAITLTLWLQTGGSCGTTAPSAGTVSGLLSAPIVLPSGATSAPAGTSVIVCAVTSVTGSYATFAGQNVAVTLTLTGSVGTQWRPTSQATFTQTLQAVASFGYDAGARYNIFNAAQCVAGKDSLVVRNNVCDFNNLGQFRISDAGAEKVYVSAAMNAGQQPTAPRWLLNSATGEIALSTPAVTASQQWVVTQRTDGLYQFKNAQYDTCAQIGPNQLYGNSGGYKLIGATCDAANAAQGFSFSIVSTSTPAPTTLVCEGNGSNYIDYSWPGLTGYEAEVTYKVYVGGIYVKDHTNGYWTHAQMAPTDLPIATFGTGTKTVEVRQSVAGGAWTPVGTGSITIASGTNNIACG